MVNVMILGYQDIGGLGRHLKKYMERKGHSVFVAVRKRSFIHPDADLVFDEVEDAVNILSKEAANTDYFIIRWMFHPDPMMRVIKPLITSRNAMIKIHGSEARRMLFPEFEQWWYMNLKYKSIPILGPWDLSILTKYRRMIYHHIERPIDFEVMPKPKPVEEPYIVASPTKPEKGTDVLIDVCEKIGGLKVGIIQGATWEQSLNAKAEAGIGFDQLAPEGDMPRIYGLSSVEFWALGKPCMVQPHRSVYSLYPELRDVIVEVNRDNLYSVVKEYRDNPKVFNEYGKKGKRFAKRYHDAARIADQYIEFIEMQLEGGLELPEELAEELPQ